MGEQEKKQHMTVAYTRIAEYTHACSSQILTIIRTLCIHEHKYMDTEWKARSSFAFIDIVFRAAGSFFSHFVQSTNIVLSFSLAHTTPIFSAQRNVAMLCACYRHFLAGMWITCIQRQQQRRILCACSMYKYCGMYEITTFTWRRHNVRLQTQSTERKRWTGIEQPWTHTIKEIFAFWIISVR